MRRAAVAASGTARELYHTLGRGDKMLGVPDDPLPHVPTHPAREMDLDLAAAKIKKLAPGGKLDFHALRACCISAVLGSGANVKEAMSLARHATADLTMNVYGRTRGDRLAELADAVGVAMLPAESTTGAQRLAAGAERLHLSSTYMVEAGGIEPPSRDISARASTCVVHQFSGDRSRRSRLRELR